MADTSNTQPTRDAERPARDSALRKQVLSAIAAVILVILMIVAVVNWVMSQLH